MLDIVFETANDHDIKQIRNVELVIGRMNQMVPDMLVFAFDSSTANTIASEARLSIDWVPIRMKCKECLTEYPVEEQIYLCPFCGSFDSTCFSGNELYVKSIEGE